MKRLILVPALSVAAVALAAPAGAQLTLDRPAYAAEAQARAPYYEARRVAYDNGYREGLKQGEKDARKRSAVSTSGFSRNCCTL